MKFTHDCRGCSEKHDLAVLRFVQKIEYSPSGCWLWSGALSRAGYGLLQVPIRRGQRRKAPAHRWAYERKHGLVPDGLVLDHLCRIRSCVNPEHLEVVTHRINVLRGVGTGAKNARKYTCPKGHALVAGNLVPAQVKLGARSCKTCRKEYIRLYMREYSKGQRRRKAS